MKFIKTQLPTGKAFISECGNYKAVNYGGKIFAFHKIPLYPGKSKKMAFGDSCFKTNRGASVEYKTYREAFRAIEQYNKQESHQ